MLLDRGGGVIPWVWTTNEMKKETEGEMKDEVDPQAQGPQGKGRGQLRANGSKSLAGIRVKGERSQRQSQPAKWVGQRTAEGPSGIGLPQRLRLGLPGGSGLRRGAVL